MKVRRGCWIPRSEIIGGHKLPDVGVGTELRSYARASIALNPWGISPALNLGDYQIENSLKGGIGDKQFICCCRKS